MSYIESWKKIVVHAYLSLFSHPYSLLLVILIQLFGIELFLRSFGFATTENSQELLNVAIQTTRVVLFCLFIGIIIFATVMATKIPKTGRTPNSLEIILICCVFMLLVGLVTSYLVFQIPIMDRIESTYFAASQTIQNLAVTTTSDPATMLEHAGETRLSVILNDQTLQLYAWDFTKLIVLLIASVYIIYTIFQSATAQIIGNMVWRKKPYTILAFLRVNVMWFIMYLVGTSILFIVDLFYSINISMNGIPWIHDLFRLILFYFVFTSYVHLEQGKAWKAIKASFITGIKQIRYYGLNYLPIALYMLPSTRGLINQVLRPLEFIPFIGNTVPVLVLFFIYLLFIANTFSIKQLIHDRK